MSTLSRTGAEVFQGLSYEDALPLEYQPLVSLPEGPALAGLNAENLQVLGADASLDDNRPAPESKADEDAPFADDLHRIEFKINVIIQLVARLASHDHALPPVAHWRLHAEGLEWLTPSPEPAPGDVAQVALYASRQFPHPLRLPGHVIDLVDDTHGRWVRFAFAGLSPSVQDGLEKMVFRHHRRAVAGVRTQPRS